MESVRPAKVIDLDLQVTGRSQVASALVFQRNVLISQAIAPPEMATALRGNARRGSSITAGHVQKDRVHPEI